jgi:hypothetical protein
MTNDLDQILLRYQAAFSKKVYREENDETDILMNVFNITSEMKRENRQYWGRELGMCWQLLVTQVFKNTRDNFALALRSGDDEPYDFGFSNFAVDTKYRIGSGDSGTLKKFKLYGNLLKEKEFTPVLLILRHDNLPSAITACLKGGWQIFTAEGTFEFILTHSGVDLKNYLNQKAGDFGVAR